MSFLHRTKMMARKFGLDIHRFNSLESDEARLVVMLQFHKIDTVIDVGANDGGYGRLLRDAGYKGKIISFEPLQDAHRRLLEAAEGDSLWMVAPPMALGSQAGELDLNIAQNSTSSSLLPMESRHLSAAPESSYKGTQRTQVCRLDEISDSYLDKNGTNFMKIDTQGFERAVLDGTMNIMNHIKGLQIELSIVPLYTGQELCWPIMDWARKQGFELCGIIPGFCDRESGQLLQFDSIFFRHVG